MSGGIWNSAVGAAGGGEDRRALLLEAAYAIDALHVPLCSGQRGVTETPEGALARSLADDVARFAAYPVVYRITDRDFLSRNVPVPVRFGTLTKSFRFYWLQVPIALMPVRNWGFNRLEVAIELSPGEPLAHLRPKAYQILPEKRFQTLLSATTGLQLRLDENFEFAAATTPLHVDAGIAGARAQAAVDAKLAPSLGLVAGPFTYRIKRAKIDHTPVGMETIRWRIEGAEFFEDDAPTLVVILQVPRETRSVTVVAALEASRYFAYASAPLQDAVRQLAARLRQFFERGLPRDDQASWDITPSL